MNDSLILLSKKFLAFYKERTWNILDRFRKWTQDCAPIVVISLNHGKVYLHLNEISNTLDIDSKYNRRLELYLDHFREIAEQNLDYSTSFALSLMDSTPEYRDVPVFQFQKPIHSNAILMPDIDFLATQYYEHQQYEDRVSYNQKINKAIFIGSTTGGGLQTIEAVKMQPSPRIRSALNFKNNNDVVFELPSICQCDSIETIKYIESLGIGAKRKPWAEQLSHKFILSMDGNGATCSRVVAALMSNSVLCKYDSIHELYYFSLLSPWVHYIPIQDDNDVSKIIDLEREEPGRFREIAENGSAFAKKYLSRESVIKYSSLLLLEYSRVFSDLTMDRLVEAGMRVIHYNKVKDVLFTKTEYPSNDSVINHLLGHIANHGDYKSADDITIGIKGSGKAIEGVTITLRDEFKENFAYRVRFQNGDYSDWITSGGYAGTRMQHLPITDFEIKASDAFRTLYNIYLCTYKTNGKQILKIEDSQYCKVSEEDTTPIEYLVLELERRSIEFSKSEHARIHQEIVELRDPVQKLSHLHKSLRILHDTFQGELAEQRLFSEFIEPGMKVLEIGANVGRSSLVIASLLNNPKNLVSFECDPISYQRLTDNRDCNGLTFYCVNAAISEKKLIQRKWQTIPSETIPAGWNEITTMTLSQVRELYPLSFDTLALDCEGAFYHILKDTPEILEGITTVIIENDFSEIMEKEFVDDVFRSRGLQVKIQKSGPWGPCADRFFEVWKMF